MATIGLSAYGMKAAELVDLAVSADALGFDALWIGEHLLRPVVQTGEHPSTGTAQHHAEFAYRGKHFGFDTVQVHPRRVDIPVIMGGNAPAALTRAARLGDGWFTSGTPDFDEAQRLVGEIHQQRARHGRTGPFTTYVRAPKADAAEVRRYEDSGLTDPVLWADTVWRGRTPEERGENLARFAEDAGLMPMAAA